MLTELKNLLCNTVFCIYCKDYDIMSERRNRIIEYMANHDREGTFFIKQFCDGETYDLMVECRYNDYERLINDLRLTKIGGRNWC